MEWNWKSVIKTVAPLLGTAVGGPFGAMAGKLVSDALGCENEEKAIAEAVRNATPEQFMAIKRAEQEFAAKMKELGIQEAKLEFDDTANARKTMTENKSFMPLFVLGLAIIVATFGLEGYAMIRGLPDTVDDLIVGRVMGTLDTSTAIVIGFWYGSSHGSQKKDEKRP